MKIELSPAHHFKLTPDHGRPVNPWGHTWPIERGDLSPPVVDPLNGLLPSDEPRPRPKPITWGKSIVDQAAQSLLERTLENLGMCGPTPKDRARKAASRRGGLRAAANMTAKQRSDRARYANKLRRTKGKLI